MKDKLRYTSYALLIIYAIVQSVFSLHNNDNSFNTITFSHENSVINQNKNRIEGSIKAKENYLGIITLHFDNSRSIQEGSATFTLKDDKTGKILSENTYDTKQFIQLSTYQFGFPVIDNAKGNSYSYTLTTDTELPQISTQEKHVQSKYSIPRAVITADVSSTTLFIFKKFITSQPTRILLYVFFVHSLPLLLYAMYPFVGEKLQLKSDTKSFTKHLDAVLVLSLIVIDVFLISLSHDLIRFSLLAMWIVLLKVHKLSPKNSFIAGLIIAIGLIPVQFVPIYISEKAATTLYYLLIIGSIHLLIDKE